TAECPTPQRVGWGTGCRTMPRRFGLRRRAGFGQAAVHLPRPEMHRAKLGASVILPPAWAAADGAPVSEPAFSVRDRTVPLDRRSALRSKDAPREAVHRSAQLTGRVRSIYSFT